MPELNQSESELVATICRLLRANAEGDPPSDLEIGNALYVSRVAAAARLVDLSRKLGVAATDRRALVKAIVDRGWCEPDGGVRAGA